MSAFVQEPHISVPPCKSQAIIPSLELADGSHVFPARTSIAICWDLEFLRLKYSAKDDALLRNDYQVCNTETWQQEVVELFISKKQDQFCLHAVDEEDHKCTEACADWPFAQLGVAETGACPALYNTVDHFEVDLQCPDGVTNLRYCPDTAMNVTIEIKGEAQGINMLQQQGDRSAARLVTEYLEVELTPQDTLYVARISNPFGNGTNKTNSMVDCAQSGINHSSTLLPAAFDAKIAVPWALINNQGTGSSPASKGDIYRVNFFRVLMTTSCDSCTPDTCAYGAWSPTFYDPPQFHVTPVFGWLGLV